MNKPLVTIIVLNWNGKELLDECLDSVLGIQYKPIEILVVDNGSTDGSVDHIKAKYQTISLVLNGRNLGYAAGNNAGIRNANGKYIVTLNNDVVVKPEWLNDPIAMLEKEESIGAISCLQLNFEKKDTVNCLFLTPSQALIFSMVGYNKPLANDISRTNAGYVICPNGGSAIYRKSMLDQIGSFDERFFAYHDESDLNMRAFLQGWKCVYVPSAIVYHKVGKSFDKRNNDKYFYGERNRIWFLFKYYPAAILLGSLGNLIIEEMRLLKFLFLEKRVPIRVYLKARYEGIRGLPQFWKDRRRYVSLFRKRNAEFKMFQRNRILPFGVVR
jgi:hypothetical protein